MKKLFLILAIASFAACNDAGSGDDKANDTTVVVPVDSAALVPAPVDSAAVIVDTTKPADTSAIKK